MYESKHIYKNRIINIFNQFMMEIRTAFSICKSSLKSWNSMRAGLSAPQEARVSFSGHLFLPVSF